MARWIAAIVLCGGLAAAAGPTLQAAEFPALLKRVPGEANILVLVDVDRLLASPMAQEQGWKKKLTQDATQRPLILPPGAHKLIRAMSIDLTTQETAFELTLLESPKGLSLANIAERQQGYVEKIANVETAWLPQGAYGVKLGSELFGFLFPANRQHLSRWLRERSGQVSGYLLEASRDMKPRGPQLILAIDLEDVVDSVDLPAKLEPFASLGGTGTNMKAGEGVVAGLRGAKLEVTFDKEASGRLIVDFERDAAPLKPIARELLLDVLSSRGFSLDEADEWKAAVEGKQVTLSGKVGESGLMRLSSLLELPSDLIADQETETAAENPMLYATQAHYKAVQTLLDDLFGKKKQSFGQYAQWAEQYAKKIDRLPLVNVDKDMQEYSARISELLRDGAVAFKGVGIRSGGRQSQVWSSGYVNYGYYGWRTYNASSEQKRSIRGEERARGASDAAQMKQMIDEESGAIRKVMADRYKVNF
jgi:hypothetical protein